MPYSTFEPYLKFTENPVWKPLGLFGIKLSYSFRCVCHTDYYFVQLYLEINFPDTFFLENRNKLAGFHI